MSQTEPRSGDNAVVAFLKKRWLGVLLVVLLLIVAIQNAVSGDKATIFVLWAELSMPTWVLVLIVFLIGGIAGWVISRNRAARKRR
jgi:lipopolysaccharide assembly protein A